MSVSASVHAGDKIGEKRVVCDDVVVISGDAEGILGAMDAGLEPGGVVDMTQCANWQEYKKHLLAAIKELTGLVAAGKVKIVVVDLALPARLILEQIKPTQISDWTQVQNEGLTLYSAFGLLKGATIIGNCQIKSAVAAVENAVATAASEARSVGGERNTFAADLPKGILSHWVENASFVLSREVKRTRDPMKKDAPVVRKFSTHTVSTGRFEAKSRAHTKLLPTEPGERTLRSLINAVYGE